MDRMDRVERRMVLDVPRPRLWRALTEGLPAWFGATVAADAGDLLAPGARLEFRWPDGTARAAVVEEVEPEQRLTFRWLPFLRLADGTALQRSVTRVELMIEDDAEGVALLVSETRVGPPMQAGMHEMRALAGGPR